MEVAPLVVVAVPTSEGPEVVVVVVGVEARVVEMVSAVHHAVLIRVAVEVVTGAVAVLVAAAEVAVRLRWARAIQ